MNIFKEIRNGINEMDPIQEQLTPREKAGAIFGVVFIMGFMLLGIAQGFIWTAIFFITIVVVLVNILMGFLAARETYYIIKRILDNMEGMW